MILPSAPFALLEYRGLIRNFARRELKSKYKRSALGWAWSLLNPAATLAVYALVFGVIFRFLPPVAGNGETRSFALYLFTGLVVWNFFFGVVTGAMGWLIGAGPLLNKISFPPAAPLVGGTLAALVQTIIEATLLVLVLVLVSNISWTLLLVPVLLALLALFALGLGLVVSLANVYYRDINYLTGIVLNLVFYATPIIYDPMLIPERLHGFPLREVLTLNPVAQFVGAMRDVTYHLQVPSAARMLGLTVISIATFTLGYVIFDRKARDVAEEL